MMLALSALLLSSPLLHTGGDVLVVDAAGGGDFTSLQAAIDAASPLGGDTILVKAGVYDPKKLGGVTTLDRVGVFADGAAVKTVGSNTTRAPRWCAA